MCTAGSTVLFQCCNYLTKFFLVIECTQFCPSGTLFHQSSRHDLNCAVLLCELYFTLYFSNLFVSLCHLLELVWTMLVDILVTLYFQNNLLYLLSVFINLLLVSWCQWSEILESLEDTDLNIGFQDRDTESKYISSSSVGKYEAIAENNWGLWDLPHHLLLQQWKS